MQAIKSCCCPVKAQRPIEYNYNQHRSFFMVEQDDVTEAVIKLLSETQTLFPPTYQSFVHPAAAINNDPTHKSPS